MSVCNVQQQSQSNPVCRRAEKEAVKTAASSCQACLEGDQQALLSWNVAQCGGKGSKKEWDGGGKGGIPQGRFAGKKKSSSF